ncbi:AAA family ATPase [Streptomyces sp. NPDC001811]
MLSYRRLTIEDFGPYRGRQIVDFPRERGVYIISGLNGRGKTKLHNAFRYALYGQIMGRSGPLSAADFANSEARKEAGGYGSFSTVLEFTHSGVPYRLTRKYDERRQPNVSVFLERDNVALSASQADKVLQQIAPVSVSRFFLFDGELLRDYENLLDAENDEGKKLEDAIERVLGIPIVANALADVEEVRTQANKRVAEQASADAKTRDLGAALTEAGDLRAEMVRDREGVREARDRTEQRIEEISADLRAQPRAENILAQIDSFSQQAATAKQQKQQAWQSLLDLSGELWQAVLAGPARAQRAALQEEVERLESELRKASADARDYAYLQSHEHCPVCRRDLDETARTEILRHIESNDSAPGQEHLADQVAHLRRHLETLLEVASYDGRLVQERDRNYRQASLTLSNISNEIIALDEQLNEVDQEKVRSLVKEREERRLELARHDKRLEEIAKDLQKLDKRIADINDLLDKYNFTPDAAVQMKKRLSDDLVGLFQQAISAYRKQLKDRVEERASAIFTDLSAEKEYTGLRITNRYGLEIVGADGSVVTGRSAGYEHLVALSLIAALQTSAAVRGTVVMDSPFGRLDSDHTANVIAALPRMAEQVVLLAFDSEFDRQAAIRALGSDLVAEYELERITPRHTQIRSKDIL